MSERALITGRGVVTALGRDPAAILGAILEGRSGLRPVERWDGSTWPNPLAGEIPDFVPTDLVPDRKIHKWIRRTDVLGLAAADRAIDEAGIAVSRDALGGDARDRFLEGTGVFVGSGGSGYEDQYDFLPLLARADGDPRVFGAEVASEVTPLWLLRTLPNNVLGHLGIRHGFKGANGCIPCHAASGAAALEDGLEAVRSRTADRAVVVSHHAPVEPQLILYFHSVGLLAEGALRPFDVSRSGTLLGEGAGAVVLESETSVRERSAVPLGELLGTSVVVEGEGLLPLRPDGDGIVRATRAALDDAGLEPADVGMVVAHGNGTRASDASEAAGLLGVFGEAMPPVTAFKWALGHSLAAAPAIDVVLALECLRRKVVPGIASLEAIDGECAGIRVSRELQDPRGDVALVIARGFGGVHGAVLVRAP